jgi:hypothetical protein
MSAIDKIGLVGEYMSILEPQEILKILIVDGEIKKIFVEARWWDLVTCGCFRSFMTSRICVYEFRSSPVQEEDHQNLASQTFTMDDKSQSNQSMTLLSAKIRRQLHKLSNLYGIDLQWIPI